MNHKETSRLKAIGKSIYNYAEQNEGSLDSKGKEEVKSYMSRLDEIESECHVTIEALTDNRVGLVKSTRKLRGAVLQSRRVMEIAAIGNPKAAALPKITQSSFLPSRIHAVAVSHREDLTSADSNATVIEARRAIDEALAEFDAVYAVSRNRKKTWREVKDGFERELATIAGKLVAYKQFAAYNVPVADRKDLRTRLRAIAPTRSHHAPVEDAVPAPAEPAKTVPSEIVPLPAVPAIPTGTTELRRDGVTSPTAVPPSSEHPALTANA